MTSDEHELRSYGRRRGRKPSARQADLLTSLLPKIAPAPDNLPLDRPLWLEIGFGGGEHLLWQARQNPEALCIGCEPFEDGVIKVLSAIEGENLGNIRIHMGDARELLRRLPAASVARAFVLFPDPWPKRKHVKRRLLNAALLRQLSDVMRSGAELRVATDIGDYARTMLEAFEGAPTFRWQADGPSDWRVRPSDWPQTRYEAKAVLANRHRYFFRFLRS